MDVPELVDQAVALPAKKIAERASFMVRLITKEQALVVLSSM